MNLRLVEETDEDTPQQSDRLTKSLLKENERLQTELNAQRRNVELFMSVFNCLPDGLAIADRERAKARRAHRTPVPK